MKIHFEIELPDELGPTFLQYMRDFDTRHDPQHEGKVKMAMTTESHHSVEEMKAILDGIRPRPEFLQEFRLDKTSN